MKNLKLILIVVLLSNCSVLQKIFMKKDPEIIIKNIKLQNINLEGFTIFLDTELVNFYKFGLPKSKLNFDVNINDHLLTKYSSNEFQIAAESSVPIPIYLKFKYQDIGKLFKEFSNSEFLKLNLMGGADFDLNIPGFPNKITVPFKVEKRIPSFMPEVQIQNMDIQIENTKFQDFLVGNTKLKLNLKLLIENKGGSSFNLLTKDTSFKLEEKDLLRISTIEINEIGKKQLLDLSTELPVTESLRFLIDSFLSSKPIKYNFESKLNFKFSNVDLNEFEFPIKYHGNLSLKK
ncbi:MAG: hypothetical protein ACK4UJ_06070 [Leptonema sp. (in: bacteria)]